MITIINIVTPQRFYQFNYKGHEGNINTIIDLKIITQISLAHKNERILDDKIIINTDALEPPIVIVTEKNEVADEFYSKLVTAWTTYKLATEK